MEILNAEIEDGELLAELRVLAMRESLETVGRFDPLRARERFLSKYDNSVTMKVLVKEQLAAFYVVYEAEDHLFLDHLYVHPEYQGNKIGSKILLSVIKRSQELYKPIKLGALKGSRSNQFYISHGFVKTHEEEFDNYYIRRQS